MKPFKRTVEKVLAWIANIILIVITGFLAYGSFFKVSVLKDNQEFLNLFKEELAKNPKVLAIGEIGLDYHWMTRPKEEQWDIFRKQLELARRVNKPVVIHTREAMEDTVNILNEFPDITGILHCYPGSVETARRMIDRFYLGIGGVLTFKNAKKSSTSSKKGVSLSFINLSASAIASITLLRYSASRPSKRTKYK